MTNDEIKKCFDQLIADDPDMGLSRKAIADVIESAVLAKLREGVVTGWDNGLSQDYDKKLGQWFANRPGARQQLRETLSAPQPSAVPVVTQMVEALEKSWNPQLHSNERETTARSAITKGQQWLKENT